MILNVIMALPILATIMWRESATNAVARRVRSKDPAKCLSRFVDYPECCTSEKFTLNPTFWLKGVDFSCVSPWNSGGGKQRAGVAISKRHIVFAKHFPLWKGVRIQFVGEDGGVCPCCVEATRPIGKTDIMIGLLNAEVTPNIRPARILPSNYVKFIGNGENFPIVTFTQNEKALLGSLSPIPTNSTRRSMVCHPPADKMLTAFNALVEIGDSGDPVFLLLGNEAVLIYCLQGGLYGSGPGLHFYRREIQAAMDALCPGYKLETFDFEQMKAKGGHSLRR